MKYYPIFLRVAQRPCVVIGGGRVAQQKVASLLKAKARITVISPDVTPMLATLARTHRMTHRARAYLTGDLDGFFLAYAATGDQRLHMQIAADAKRGSVLLNVVDQPDLCDFIVPSVMQRGELIIATSTSGASPAMARRIRQELEATYGTEYSIALELLGRLRERFASVSLSAAERQRIFGALLDSPLLEYLRAGRTGDVDRLLATAVGGGVSLASLGLEAAS